MSLRAVIWVLGTECFGQLIGGHQPSTSAVSVPLMGGGVYPSRTVCFVYPSACSQTYLGHP